MYQWNRLIFGRADAPYIAIYVIKNHVAQFKDQNQRAVDAIQYSSYVDDIADSVDTEEEAVKVQHTIDQMLDGAGMKVKKWITSCNECIDERSHEKALVGTEESILGLVTIFQINGPSDLRYVY